MKLIVLIMFLVSSSIFAEMPNGGYVGLSSTEVASSESFVVNEGLEKNNICQGVVRCWDGRVVSCVAYGTSCTWFTNARGAQCTGYDQYGRWGTYWARCF